MGFKPGGQQTMLAIDIRHPGAPDVLVPASHPIPHPDRGYILVRVEAAGVNRPDILQRRGLYPPPAGASEIPGLEIAGEVVALGEDAGRYDVGDKVCALVAGGGYAEYCIVHESNALPVPQSLSMVEAGALPETFFTVWVNVFQRGKLAAGETVLIHGGSSGIGTAATMLSKAFGATVLVTVGTEEKRQACLALGADLAINYRTQDFVEETRKFTDGKGVAVVVDLIAGDYVARNYEAAAEWPYYPDRYSEWPRPGTQSAAHVNQASHAYGFDIAVPQCPGESADCAGTGTAGLAAVAPGKIKTPDIQGFQAEGRG